MVKIASDESILFDLEYRGLDNFLGEMEEGFLVPLFLVETIKRLVEKEYKLSLEMVGQKTKKQEAWFCGMEYNDSCIMLRTAPALEQPFFDEGNIV